jgi:hypothetical protein
MIRFWRVRSLVGKAAIFARGFGPPVLGAGDRLKSPLPAHHRAAESRVVGADGPRRRRPDSDRPLRVGPPVQRRCIFTVPEDLPESPCVSPRVSSADGSRRGTTPGWRCASTRRTRRPLAHGRNHAWSLCAGPDSAAPRRGSQRGHLRGGLVTTLVLSGSVRARNPRWEPGMMGMIPDPRQIGDGDGSGPPIPGESGMGMGVDPRL